MAKGSGGTRGNSFKDDKFLNDLFHSSNYIVNAALRGQDWKSLQNDSGIDDNDIKNIIKYIDKAISNYGTQEGKAYRAIGFDNSRDFNAVVDSIVMNDGNFKDKGFSFVSTNHIEDIYGGASYSISFEYSSAKYLDFGKIQKGYKNTGVIPRDAEFKVDSITAKDSVGHHLVIKLHRK